MTRPFHPNRKTRIIWAADAERERRRREFWRGFWAWLGVALRRPFG